MAACFRNGRAQVGRRASTRAPEVGAAGRAGENAARGLTATIPFASCLLLQLAFCSRSFLTRDVVSLVSQWLTYVQSRKPQTPSAAPPQRPATRSLSRCEPLRDTPR